MKALGELRQSDMADKIVPFTASENREIRLVAYQALAEMGVPQALEPMRQAYETAPPYEKAKVASYGLAYARRLAESGDLQTANTICEYPCPAVRSMSGRRHSRPSPTLAILPRRACCWLRWTIRISPTGPRR